MNSQTPEEKQKFAWVPSEERIEKSNLKRFMDKNDIKTFGELQARSVRNPSWFWDAVNTDLNIHWHKKYSTVLDESIGAPWTKWFVDGELNIAANCIDFHKSDHPFRFSLISESERPGHVRRLTYSELSDLTNQIANALTRELKLRKQDKVGIYMPMSPEAVAAFFAVIKLGGVVVPIFSGYGKEAIASRLADCDARAIITVESSFRRDKITRMKETAIEASKEIPTIESLLVFDSANPRQEYISRGNLAINHWDTVLQQKRSFETVQMNAEDPFMIIYTSGTTGKPKGAVHVHGGFLVKIAEEVAYQADVKEDDVLFWFTDMGWIMAPWELVGGFCLGSTVLLYDGAPDYPYPDRIWEVVEQNKVTVFGVSPTLIRAQMKYGPENARKHDLSSLKSFCSTGEPWNPESYNWLSRKVGNGERPIINLSGGTEVGACFLSVHPILPTKVCSLGGPSLGIDADVFDEKGNPVRNQTGELVVKKPWPSMSRGLWKSPERYIETYWSRFPQVWVHGDWASIDEDGYWFLHGRSDDTLKIAGKRIGPAEIESVLASHDAVLESVAIGVPDDIKGESAVCFVVLRPDYVSGEKLRKDLAEFVAFNLGSALKPSAIRFVNSLPKTRNAKLIRRLVRATYLGQNPGDMSNLENPESLDGIANSQ